MAPATLFPWRLLVRPLFIALAAFVLFVLAERVFVTVSTEETSPQSNPSTEVAGLFTYEFKDPGILHESDSPDSSSSPYWWVDSGAKLIVEDGVGKTLQGELAASDAWRTRYARTSKADTDNGEHPQNLFRLLTRSEWENVRVESSFRITADNFSKSENRDESNGILLMSHYKDENDLYYAGLRVDGHAVIKKKTKGAYKTLAEKSVFPGTYSRTKNTNLLPHDKWIELRMETKTDGDAVTITLSQKNENGEWHELLLATDSSPIEGSHPVGVRTDFMDVEFDNFRAENI